MCRILLPIIVMLALFGCRNAEHVDDVPRGQSPLDVYQIQVPAFGGYLLGSDQGEWGGRLSFLYENGQRVVLMDKNVVGIHRLPFGYAVVTGLAHLSINEGELFLVTHKSEEQLRVDRLMVLPHAPQKSWQRPDGSLDIAMFTGEFDGEGGEGKPVFACIHYTLDRTVEPMACPPCTTDRFCWR
jgi:hypothetical protein